MKNLAISLIATVIIIVCWGCSSTKHVPAGRLLLDNVLVKVNDSTGTIDAEEMTSYLRQLPNHKILWSMKMQLGVYNLSGKDSTNWWNRWMRRMGEAPVLYDTALTTASSRQLERAMENLGFLGSSVEVDTVRRGKKMNVTYRLTAGRPHTIRDIVYEFPNNEIMRLVLSDSAHMPVRVGDRLDRTLLESEREFITRRLRDRGYYAFTKDLVSFNADTLLGSKDVDLTVRVTSPVLGAHQPNMPSALVPYRIRNVKIITHYNLSMADSLMQRGSKDTVEYHGLTIYNGEKAYLRPSVIYENCSLRPGELYNLRDVDRTYERLSRLGILKYVDIRFVPVSTSPVDEGELDAYVLLTPGKSQSISFELEGTNSEGDLGAAASVTYTHRNIGRGSETFTTKLRGAYESVSGKLEGFLNDRFMEYSVETDLNFPKFKFPLLHESFKRKIRASTDFNLSFNYQERPEYTRIIGAGGWAYKWSERQRRLRHTFTLIDVNYVYLPKSTNNFLDEIAPDNPLLRYSYEDHFIMRMGYNFYYTTKRDLPPWSRRWQENISTLRAHVEVAGNLLFALSSIFDNRKNFHTDPYKVFGIRYSQYVKVDCDYSFLHRFDLRNTLAARAGFGIGVPYANSSILPFEKRFYGGGANGVRGWGVRTLGPGSYRGSNSVSDFIHQCGDIRLDLGVEYRAKLFWVLELGLFVDAGNIWTIRDYESQPGGVFRFNEFYKQLAASYGLGLRFDFDYFLIRFDMGMKAHNPAEGEEPWPLIHPRWGRDHSFHFSIGYPF